MADRRQGRWIVLLTCSSLVAASLTVPLTHVHEDAGHADAHHDGRTIHSHVQVHTPVRHHPDVDAAVLTAADHDDEGRVQTINPFQMVDDATLVVAGPPPSRVLGDALLLPAGVVRPIVQRSHSPPIESAQPSRAPPARPVLI